MVVRSVVQEEEKEEKKKKMEREEKTVEREEEEKERELADSAVEGELVEGECQALTDLKDLAFTIHSNCETFRV